MVLFINVPCKVMVADGDRAHHMFISIYRYLILDEYAV
jgi:hypothetical protein